MGGPAIQDLETEIRHACRRPEALETVLAALQGEGLILYVLIDAIEEGCSPGELLQSAFLLLARYADRGLRIAMTVRDVAFDYLTRSPHVARVLESIRKHLSHFETEECGKRISRPYFLLPRVNEEELNTFLELYFSEYNICSGKISKNSKQILMNPLLLRMVCESYSGQHIPQNITAHKIFNEYIKVKLVNPITNKFDKESIRLLQRLVQLLFDKKITQIDEDLLYDDNYFGKFIRDNDLNSPFNRLLDQAILVRIVEDNDSPFSPISVRVNFDRLLEVLALDIFEKKGLHALLAEIGKKPVFGPLVGVLTLWLLKAGESLDTLPFSLVAENLFDDDVSRATLRALEEISFTDFPFVVRVVEILGDTASPAALECALKLTRLCSHSGRWQMSTEILRVIRKTKGSKSRDCKFIIQKIELVNANDLFKMGKNREALAVFHELIDSPDASIQAEALQGEILVYDSYDQTAYFEASEKCLALADEIGNPDLRAFALWSLGGYYEYKNQYEEALAFYQRILEMESLGEKGQVLGMRPYIDDLAPVYTWIGRALQGIPRRAAEAETFFRKALEMDQKAGRLYRISVGWNNLASFFFQVAGDTSSALQYSDKELSQELLFPNDPEWACSYYIRSCIMMMLGNWDEAGASAAKSVHISDGFRLAGEGHQNYLGYGYFSCFCVALGKGDTVGAKSMLDDLSSLDRDAETDPELDLMVKTADFALSCIEGRLPGRKCLDDLLEQYRAHNLVIPGCNHVGLVLLAIDRTKRSLGHPGFFETLYGVAMEIGNRFWMEFTSGRRFNLPDKACVTATTAQSGEKEVIMRSSMKSQGFIKPPGLRPGDRIAVIAPSSPVDTVQIRAGLEIMREKALEPVLGRNLRFVRSRGLYAAPLKDRIQECIEAFADPSISAIIVGTGGFGSSQLLPHLPYDRIRREPKILMGFSDVTALNAGLLTKAGLISFNGPSASIRQDTEGNARADGLALRDALDLLMCGKPWKERPFLRNKMLPRCVFPGCAEGPAIGGNLTTLACLMGTPFFPDPSGAILFLEDIHEGGYEMARTLNHLRLGGILDQISGVVLGEFAKAPDHVDPGDPSIEEVIFEFFSEGPPCVYGYNFSHGDTGAVLPVGGMVRLDAEACQVEFDSPILL
ncbi:MAG: LD-carboxypeptidase [Syntrophotaleaceae bacterium]